MARNIYKNNNQKLRELKQARSVDLLAQEVQRMSKQINQRFYRLEKQGKGLTDTAYRYAQKELERDKPRYSVNLSKLKEMSIQELYELGIEINAKLVSKTSTIRGLSEVAQKRLEMGLREAFDVPEGEKITQDMKDEFDNFLANGGSELMNSKWLDSYQVAEDWREYTYQGGVSLKDFVDTYNTYKEKEVDYGYIRRNLNKINRK